MSKNMDDFNRATALILEKLYDNFPKKLVPLDISKLEDGIDQETLDNYCATALFLNDEGFIICGDSVQNKGMLFPYAKLTSKGLATLKMIPDAINNKDETSFADRIKSTLKSGTTTSINAVVTQIISAYIRITVG